MVVIVTEKVQPLNSIKFDINNKFDQLSISWGLHQVLVFIFLFIYLFIYSSDSMKSTNFNFSLELNS